MKEYIVILSGWAVPRFVWIPLLELLEADYEVIYLDWHDVLTTEDYVNKAARVIKEKELQSFTVMGWSLGSMVAIDLIASQFFHVKKCILISGTSKFVRGDQYPIGWRKPVLEAMKRNVIANPKATLHQFYTNLFNDWEKEAGYHEANFQQITVLQSSLEVGLDYLMDMDMRQKLADIDCPVLLLHGEEDVICTIHSSVYLQEHLKQTKLVRFKNLGHIPFYTQPLLSYQEIDSFMKKVKEHD